MDFNYYYNEVMHHEWVISNKKGGYSMGCGNFVNKRKYNGVLIAAGKDLKRTHIVQAQEIKARWRSKEIYLDSNNYAECIYPDGYEHIVKTWMHPYPAAAFSSVPASEDFLIVKEIKMHPSKNIVKTTFTNFSSSAVEIEIRPKFSLRDHHTVNPPDIWDRTPTVFLKDTETSASFNRLDTGVTGFISAPGSLIREDKIIFRNVFYPNDSMRGYDAVESVISPCVITFRLEQGAKAFILYSDEPVQNGEKISKEIDRRYKNSVMPKDHPGSLGDKYCLKKTAFSDDNLYPLKKYPDLLDEIFDTFVIKDDIIAGFPWFSCWGRDTMISMKALLYSGNEELYLKILDKYGKKLQKGILPNVIGEGGEGTNYNSADAALWLAVRIGDIYPKLSDDKVKDRLFGYLCEIAGNYGFNRLLPFFLDDDGLIEIKTGDDALTWMDAKVYNKPVTPRWGKPVEINALWYNVLKVFESAAGERKTKTFRLKYIKFSLKDITSIISKIKASAEKFIVNGHIADRIENGYPVDEFRPNVLIATSLPHKLWNDSEIGQSLKIAAEELLTPYGVRTLTPRNSSFKKKFIGSHNQLDMAYHQGTVWAWLLGPYIETFVHVNRRSLKKSELKNHIDMITDRLKQGILKGHIASVAEVWDGENPHFPKGCPAQAWSVAALITAEHVLDRTGATK